MGGTSADVALIRDFQADISFERDVAGFSVRLPAVDIETVGAGGGSIAWFDRDGLLKVGPASAGADPGPCLLRARRRPAHGDGREPRARADCRAAASWPGRWGSTNPSRGPRSRLIAERLGFEVERTAHGVLGIVVANMVRANPDHLGGAWLRPARVHPDGLRRRRTAARARCGARPRDARDTGAGGAGDPVRGGPDRLRSQGGLRRERTYCGGMQPGSSRLGRARRSPDRPRPPSGSTPKASRPRAAGSSSGSTRATSGRTSSLSVPVAAGNAGADAISIPASERLRERFLEVHESAYGYANPHDPIEIVNVQAHRPRPAARGARRSRPRRPWPAPRTVREPGGTVHSRVTSRPVPVYARQSLRAGHILGRTGDRRPARLHHPDLPWRQRR